ncbi:hypothetical protein ACWX0P_27335 [Vibrio mediterranei]
MSKELDISTMPLYQEAERLLKSPVTVESFIQWEALMKQAHGVEAVLIGQVYEGLLAALDETEYGRWEEWHMNNLEVSE